MLDDIRARLKGGLYDPLVAEDIKTLLGEVERLQVERDDEMAHAQVYRIGELPKWVVINEGGAAYIDTMCGRYWLKPGDTILYNSQWKAIDVVRAKRA